MVVNPRKVVPGVLGDWRGGESWHGLVIQKAVPTDSWISCSPGTNLMCVSHLEKRLPSLLNCPY